MICNDITYIHIHAQYSKNFSSQTKHQLANRTIIPLLALFLSNYYGLIRPINLKKNHIPPTSSIAPCLPAAIFAPSRDLFHALALLRHLKRDFSHPNFLKLNHKSMHIVQTS